MPDTDEVRAIFDEACAKVAALESPSMVGNWLIIMERYDENGEPWLMNLASSESTIWNRIGMLDATLIDQRASWQVIPDGGDE